MKTGMEIDWETADRITLLNLQDNLKYLQKELKRHKEDGLWMHPDDALHSEYIYIPALRAIIKYYGGEV